MQQEFAFTSDFNQQTWPIPANPRYRRAQHPHRDSGSPVLAAGPGPCSIETRSQASRCSLRPSLRPSARRPRCARRKWSNGAAKGLAKPRRHLHPARRRRQRHGVGALQQRPRQRSTRRDEGAEGAVEGGDSLQALALPVRGG